MQFALTGAFGHLGMNLMRHLSTEHRVTALHRSGTAELHGIQAVKRRTDFSDINDLSLAFAGCDAVFHLASPMGLSLKNTDTALSEKLTGNVIQACRQAGVKKLIHFSSVHVYKPAAELNENSPYHINSPYPYDQGKIASEIAVLKACDKGLDSVILQPASVLGPDDWRPSPQGKLIYALMQSRMPVLLQGGYSWVDSRDIARAALQAVYSGRSGNRYLLSGDYAEFREVAAEVSKHTGSAEPDLYFPLSTAAFFAGINKKIADAFNFQTMFTPFSISAVKNAARFVDTQKAQKDLNFSCRNLTESICDTIDFFKTNSGSRQ